MTLSRLQFFLRLGERRLDRNFTLHIVNGLNSTFKSASVEIKKDYWPADNGAISEGDELSLSMSVNGGEQAALFSGFISSVGEAVSHYTVKAIFSAFKAEPLNETYRGISYEEAFAKLADKLEYRAEDASPEQIVLQGSPSESFRRLINSLSQTLKTPVYYYLKRDNTLAVTTEVGGGLEYNIDNMTLRVEADRVEIFPIPDLEIGDSLVFNGQKKTVQALAFDTQNRAELIVHLKEYSPP